ncbi:auxin-responsive protein IAA33-like [Aristolochia californica]|uniref:auxin-responsive protein IAA33-like n=1 Tax=Aristolochia californica TaxID=171875 RepID=UPI0035E04934
MNTFSIHQEAWINRAPTPTMHTCFLGVVPSPSSFQGMYNCRSVLNFPGMDEELTSSVVPPVTVVLEGRTICHRISLHKHASYQSLAKALQQMFTDVYGDMGVASDADLDMTNAVPGHMVAYEDLEDDLLLAGDLKWK